MSPVTPAPRTIERADTIVDLRDGRPLEGRIDEIVVSDSTPVEGPVEQVPAVRRGRLRRAFGALPWIVALVIGLALLVPTLLGYQRYAIVGGSMEGSIAKGSAVYSEPVPVGDLVVGDTITFVPPPDSGITTLVTHRIHDIDIADDGTRTFRTKGDANADVDPWEFQLPGPEQAVVRHAVPYLGYALVELADPDVRRLVVAVPAGLIALGAVFELLGVSPGALLPRRRRVAA